MTLPGAGIATAFCDAIFQDDSAVLETGDELLRKITRELVETVRRNATLDWSEKVP